MTEPISPATLLALAERVRMHLTFKEWCKDKDAIREALREAAASMEVPGGWICGACGYIQEMRGYVSDDASSVDLRPIENNCPNDGTTLRALTWKEEAEAQERIARSQMERAEAAEALCAQKEAARAEAQGRYLTERSRLTDAEALCATLRSEKEDAHVAGFKAGWVQGSHDAGNAAGERIAAAEAERDEALRALALARGLPE